MPRLLPAERDEPLLLAVDERERAELDRELDPAVVFFAVAFFAVAFFAVVFFAGALLAGDRFARVDRFAADPPDERFAEEPDDRFALEPLDRFVAEPLDLGALDAFATGAVCVGASAAGGGDGDFGGGVAAAVATLVRPPATFTSGSQPSSRSDMSAPAAIAAAAISPRKIPTLRSPGFAKNRQRMIITLSVPSAAVTAPRGAGMLTLWPDIARHASTTPETEVSATMKPVTSPPSASQPLRSPVKPVPLNQSKNRNTNRAMPAMPARISPVRSLEESNSTSLDGRGCCGAGLKQLAATRAHDFERRA